MLWLRREILAVRRRWSGLFVAIITVIVLAQFALFTWLTVHREKVRIVHDTVTTTTTHVVPMPVPVEVERLVNVPLQHSVCPPPRRDAPRIVPGEVPSSYHMTHLRPSPTNAGWIATWNEYEVWISTDAGASWKERLDGKGDVRDVSFDCFGRALVVRGNQLGILEGESERWVPLHELALTDGENTSAYAAILGGGPDIAIVGNVPHGMGDYEWTWQSRLIVSHDLGGTWLVRPLVEDWEGGRVIGRQYEDGRIAAMLPESDCGGDSAYVFQVDTAGNLTGGYDVDGETNMAIYDDLVVTENGFKRFSEKQPHEFAMPDDERHLEVLEGPYPILASETTLYRLANGKLTKLPWKLPPERSDMITDAAGRVWSLVCGQLTIATRDDAPVCDCDGP